MHKLETAISFSPSELFEGFSLVTRGPPPAVFRFAHGRVCDDSASASSRDHGCARHGLEHLGFAADHRLQSASASRFTAGASGLLLWTQSGERPDLYRESFRFDTMPSWRDGTHWGRQPHREKTGHET